MDQVSRWYSYPDTDTLRQEVVQAITTLANRCIETHGAFHMVLAGGSTPKAIYRDLSDTDTDWSCWHIYFGDERCLPTGDGHRNDTMATQVWLQHVPIPVAQIHAIPAELGCDAGARAYHELLANIGTFDLVLLGLGEDGHTASLFPGHALGVTADSPEVLAVTGAPKPPADRISLSAHRLGRAEHVWFLVTGEGKRQAVEAWRRGDAIPAASICPKRGVDIYTDLVVDSF